MTSLKTALVTTALLAGLGVGSGAEALSIRKACTADMKTYCRGLSPFGSGLGKCMKAHWDDLSEDCRAAIREREEKHHKPSDESSSAS